MFCVCRSSNSLCKLHIAINFALAKMAAAMNSRTVAVSPSEAPEGLHRTTRCASSAARSVTAGACSGIFAAMVRRRKVTAARSSRATRSGRRKGQGTRPTRRRRRRSRRDRGRIGSERMPNSTPKTRTTTALHGWRRCAG